MDIGTVLSAAQTLFAALQCKELQDIFSFLGYNSQLEDLQRSVNTVRAVLRDAETKELGHEAQLYIDELKDAVYDADDLFDRFATLAKQKQLIKGGKVSKKVRRFFSRHNPLGFAYTMSQGAKEVRKSLDAIANDHKQFGFSIDPQPMRLRRDETCSYVYQNHIVGREDDVNKIMGHLLGDSNPQNDNVSFLSVVGIGGLGKTALAQLVFNDSRVSQGENAFPLRIWTCVADHDKKRLDVAQILGKILNSLTGGDYKESTLQYLQSQVVEKIMGKKFLLVLDDVWTEDHHQWLELAEFFLGSQVKGSWILITTRSHETANIIGHGPKHELQGLSSENSWCLFHKIAFDTEQSATPDEDLVGIGHEIVEGCAGVPLAIRVAGSLLYGQDKSKWLSFKKAGLTNFKENQSSIKHILKFSYHQLESPLKSCFTYCALFPKDYAFDKEELLSLWIAQGYVVPLVDGQTVEDAAEEYFSILLRRCFFQDIHIHEFIYRIDSFKLHDLMHDYALAVAEKEFCVINFPSNINMDKKVRHVGYASDYFAEPPFKKNRVRSYCYIGNGINKRPRMVPSTLEALLSNSMCLRALDLKNVGLISLPTFIGKLLHLRYLDISENDKLEALPKSIENLCNLQTIKIGGCSRLKDLPKDFLKSVNYNIRILEISECGIEYLNFVGTLLPNLKILALHDLEELEYILIDSTEDGCLFLPSLEELYLSKMPNLKGWRDLSVRVGDVGSCSSTTTLLFPQLNILAINGCKEMKCNLVCPKLEILGLDEFNEELQVSEMRRKVGDEQTRKGRSSSTRNISSSFSYGVPKLRAVRISNVRWLNRMPMESFQCLVHLWIEDENEVESLGDVEGVLRSFSSSLKILEISGCSKMRRVIYGGLEHLTCLKKLKIYYGDDLEEEDWNKDGTLLPKLETLKIIKNCKGWKAIPGWIPKLTSLKTLKIMGCSEELKQRCENPNGEDWHLIQHIPSITIW